MITDLAPSPTEHRLPTPVARRDAGTVRPRVIVLESDAPMVALLGDILADDYEAVPVGEASIADIDRLDPDLILIGTPEVNSRSALTPEEVIALSARHMRLSEVPIIVLSVDPNVLASAKGLAQMARVTVVSMPFDAETLWCVLKSVTAQVSKRAPSHLPQVCGHGYDVDDADCARCT